jgi:hypothetical protein
MWRGKSARSAVGLQPDLSGLLTFGMWGGYDWDARSYFASFTLAVDIMALSNPVGALLHPGPREDFQP